jgi:glycosyltransferase involved in cell wall biosynthesis
MIKDLVSVIIPVYNRGALIEETILSILKQNYLNIECIIIDDNSSDNTVVILQKMSELDNRVKYFIRPINIRKGANSCRNIGFRLSKGEFIVWFDSDDIMPENSITSRYNLIKNSNYDFVLGRLLNFNSSPAEVFDLKKSSLYPSTSNAACDYIIGNYWFQTSVPLFKRLFLLKFKKHFDQSISFHDEGELFVRLLLASPFVHFTDDIVTLRRMHNSSESNLYISGNEAENLLKDQFGSLKIWKSFRQSKKYYNESIHTYYKYYFFRWVLKMKFNLFRLLWILFLGLRFKMFDSPLKVSKIVFWRIIYFK